ncbi:glycosyltransferase family 9 protein [Micromonospora schwarzwaldensis]|uniref:glycosyltransferase family 9 protein n=1 Tax=Micromonospora sp. DSM 45708 TaxID=3111767 RepID=UPI0031E00647
MSADPTRRLFVIDFTGLGSACLAVPVLRGLEAANPGIRYTYPQNAILRDEHLRAASDLRGILELTPSHWRRFDPADWRHMTRVIELHRIDTIVNFRNPDLTVDPRFPQFRAWCRENGPEVRWHDLYDVPDVGRLHVHERMRAVLASAGLTVAPVEDQWLAGSPPVHPVIGFFSSASAPTKRWPIDRWVELAGELASDQVSFVILGGAGGEEWAEALALAERLGRVVPAERLTLAPATGVRELTARLAALSVLVANDTGVGHLAAACGTPVVSVFLSTVADVWAPRSPGGVAVQSAIGARCPNQRPAQGNCTRHYDHCVAPCHLDLTAAQVGAAVRTVLSASRRDRDVP